MKIERFAVFDLNVGPKELESLVIQFVQEWQAEIESSFLCLDCSVDTRLGRYNYYSVYDRVWLTAHPADKGMLCLSCLSARLGRPLMRDDFDLSLPINNAIKEWYESTENSVKTLSDV